MGGSRLGRRALLTVRLGEGLVCAVGFDDGSVIWEVSSGGAC